MSESTLSAKFILSAALLAMEMMNKQELLASFAYLPLRTFSELQIIAANQIVNGYARAHQGAHRWGSLIAPMQSGKTETFLLSGAEMWRLKKVNKIVVFSGNTDSDLKKQLENDVKKFSKKYHRYLRDNVGITSEDQRDDMCDELLSAIVIVWGATLNKYTETSNRTFFIWDEAHAAQDYGMRPAKFLTRAGISGDGNPEKLHSIDSYVLTVSATPFSEHANKKSNPLSKFRVFLKVTDHYYSVENMWTNGKIQSFDHWESGLEIACEIHKGEAPSYSIVRVANDAMGEVAMKIAEQRGWRVWFYDSSDKSAIESLSCLQEQPTENTLVIIKGMARMGKKVPKNYISFVFETSSDSNTDVVLQSLVGRMCGYDGNRNIIIYISRNVFNSGEIDRYINFINSNGDGEMPFRGKNLTGSMRIPSGLSPVVPLKFNSIGFSEKTRREQIAIVRTAFASDQVENHNNVEQYTEVKQQVTGGTFTIRDASSATYRKLPEKLCESIRTTIPQKLGSACGIPFLDKKIAVYFYKDPVPEFNIAAGDIFVYSETTVNNPNYCDMEESNRRTPGTNKKEYYHVPTIL